MGNLEDKPGRSPGQSPQEKFGLVETDRLIEAVKNSTFLLEPQKEMVIQLIRAIPEDLSAVPANVMPFLVIQRAEERDRAVSENHHLWEENRGLRDENNRLKREVDGISKELSQIREPLQKKIEEEEEISDGAIYERRILERVTNVYEGFVKDLQLVLDDISCKNKDFDGLGLLSLALVRLLGIDIEQLSPLERREIGWIARDLGYDPDHEVDTSSIEHLIVSLEQKLEKAREIYGEQPWPPLSDKPTEEEDTT